MNSGKNQQAFARFADVRFATLVEIEEGRLNPTGAILEKLAKAFGCKPEDLQ
jgi:DNA-binding XRE family transcriptional regulator